MKRVLVFSVLLLCFIVSGCGKSEPVGNFSTSVMKTMPMPEAYSEEELKNKILEITDTAKGDWSVHIEIPERDFVVQINNKNVHAASVIKMFNMATLFDEEEKGSIAITERLYDTCYEMITVSSNSASNEIVQAIGDGNFVRGAKVVTEFAHKNNCTDTQEEHPLYDLSGPGSGINTTSVADCAKILKQLYNGELVSETSDEKMLEIMKNQTFNHKIPAYLPKDTAVAHKTGENSKVELDVGIVYSPACDYIICISVTDFKGFEIHSTFAEISRTVYNFFNRI